MGDEGWKWGETKDIVIKIERKYYISKEGVRKEKGPYRVTLASHQVCEQTVIFEDYSLGSLLHKLGHILLALTHEEDLTVVQV